jgi:tetratricopeptide (TPR) repeat protein
MENISIFKELIVKDYTFNLKSETTGKYSVHDSYRDNYNNGFLVKIEAPADVNLALKDIYYANDKGLIISYKEFNNKIITERNQILAQKFPGQELKDLSKDDKLKTERESAKNVLKELSISESTKLIYSPELTTLKLQLENDYDLLFVPEDSKVLFYTPDQAREAKQVTESKKKAPKKEKSSGYSEFSESVKVMVEKAMDSHNLDELELTILELEKSFNNLAKANIENPDFEAIYAKNKSILNKEAELIKAEQQKFEASLNKKVNDLINNKAYKKIKQTILDIKKEFSENTLINNDTKSKNIKDLAIEKLSNVGKVISLVFLKDWNNKNLKVSEGLLAQSLPLELETILKKKHEQEETKVKTENEKLQGIDIRDSDLVFNRFKELTRYKPVFINLFDMLTEKGFEDINSLILDLKENYAGFLLLLANNLPFEKFSLLWDNLSPQLINKILIEKFPFSSFTSDKLINVFIKTVLNQDSPDIIIDIADNIKTKTVKSVEPSLLLDLIIISQSNNGDVGRLLNKIYPDKILAMAKLEKLKQHPFFKNLLISTLLKWFPTLNVNQPEFLETLINFPLLAIDKLKTRQIDNMKPEFVLQILENFENNTEVLQYFAYRIGRENYDAALKIKLANLVRENPGSYENHYNLGITYINTKDYNSAVLELKKALGLNSDLPEGHFNLGFALEKLGQTDLAMSEYKKAISKKYGYIEAYYNLGLLYSKLNDNNQAIQQFKKIQKIEPDNYEAALSLAIIHDEQGELNEAIKEYERAVAINPEKPTAIINLANCYSLAGNTDAAVDLYTRAITLDPENPIIQYNLGIIYQQQQKYSMAKAHYKMAIRFNNNYSEAYSNLGLVYFFMVNLPDAIEMWEKSIEIDDNIDAYNNLGWGYYVIGQLDKAVETYLKAKELNPKHSILSLNLGTVYFKKMKSIKRLKNWKII